ncbi:hypothetical protein LUPAC06_05987 [Micromonospora saelicesensis]|nr:hypothetical protein LUPAC06_05987 [Micromonospora saelicesensis]
MLLTLVETGGVPIRRLPDLTPEQVVKLQNALLANANTLLESALAILDLGYVALARSIAILGMEESGKAIAIHDRRVAMGYLPDGETFRCESLDELWSSHQKKLETVYGFLAEERYWFGEPANPERNVAALGTIRAWLRRDRIKQRGFYVEIDKVGEALAPDGVANEVALRETIAQIHQIGWQLRLGEHVEGKQQDEKESGASGLEDEALTWLDDIEEISDASPFLADLKRSLKSGTPGEALPNAAYRFNPPGVDRQPFRNLGKPGYEAETRELISLADELDKDADPAE